MPGMRVKCGHIAYTTVRYLTILGGAGIDNGPIITTDTPLMSLSLSGALCFPDVYTRGADTYT